MGEIVAFSPRLAARPRSSPDATARILLFTGVSYERYAGAWEPPSGQLPGDRKPPRKGASSKKSRQRA